mmetsp:Transcript_101393/g.295410  ORF Transcript_101393/g.295410 Transcript_101393/m.295410 type:complete len:542 (+) Transcript_101393:40-1665(+)
MQVGKLLSHWTTPVVDLPPSRCGCNDPPVMDPAWLGWSNDHALANRFLRDSIHSLEVEHPQHVRDDAHDLQEAKLLPLAQAPAATEGDVGKLAGDAVHEAPRLELVGLREALRQPARDVRRDGHDAAPRDVVALVLDVRLHRPHEQHQRGMQPQDLHHHAPQLLHLAVALEGEGRIGSSAPQGLPLLLLQHRHDLRPREDLERGPRCRDGAVMHTSEEGSDQETHNLLVAHGPAVGVGGAHGLPQEVVLLDLALCHLLPPRGQDRHQALVHLAAGPVARIVPGDGGRGPEDGDGLHALLQDVQQLADAVARGHGVHLAPELVAHQAADGSPGEALNHRRPNVKLPLGPRPLFTEELSHLLLQRAHVEAQAVVRQALADEAELAHARAVVGVVEDLLPKDGDGKGVHLGLVQVLVHGEEELLALRANEEDHLLGQEVDLEALAVLLLTFCYHLLWVHEELNDGADQWQTEACRELRGCLPIPPPPPQQDAGEDADAGARRHERRGDGRGALRVRFHGGPRPAGAAQAARVLGGDPMGGSLRT